MGIQSTVRFLLSGCFLALAIQCGGGGSGTSTSGGGTPPAAPAITAFAAASPTLQQGAGTVLTYTFANGTGTITPGIGPVSSGGSTNISPATTTTYTLTVTNAAGASTSQAVTVTVGPGAPSAMTKLSGDAQSGTPGGTLPASPAVSVVNGSGAPLAGVAVAFVVLEGGGRVGSASAITDAAGRASCGTWTLGATKGVNLLAARVTGLADLVFTASAATTSAEVTVNALAPTPGLVVGETVTVAATVSSTYQLASVTATNGTASTALVMGTYGRFGAAAWVGSLSYGTRPRGPAGLTITATDVLGHSTDLVVPVTLDRPPVVTVAAPLAQALARPTLALTATCTDDDPAGPTSLTARVNGTSLATGVGNLATTLNLAAYEGQSISLDITGVDSIGQQTTVSRTVHVESSANLSLNATLPGVVWDVLGTRILYLDTTGATPALCIRDTAKGTTEVVEMTSNLVGTWGLYGYLTATGALYVRGANPMVFPYAWLFEWRNGQLANLGGLNSATSLAVAGSYAIYNTQIDDGTGNTPIWRRDLQAGTSVQLRATAGNNSNGVAANGDVTYWAMTGALGVYDYNIYRYRNGTTTALTSDASTTAWNTYPLTDGALTVYRRQDKATGSYQLMLHNGTTATALTASTATQPNQGAGYAVAGGFVAYLVEDLAKKTQVWRHSPSGESQVTQFGTSSTLDLIGPDGTILFVNQAATPRRYRSVPGSAIQDIGSSLGRVVHRDGAFLVILGCSVLEVKP